MCDMSPTPSINFNILWVGHLWSKTLLVTMKYRRKKCVYYANNVWFALTSSR